MNCLKCLHPMNEDDIYYGLHAVCFIDWFKAPVTASFVSLTRHQTGESSDSASQNNSFFLGRFKKYSANIQDDSYILKMREAEAPELPEVEYLCNQIAKLLNISVAPFFMIRLDDERVFVTKNFINLGELSDLQHIHHFRTNEQHNCEELIRIIAATTQRPHDVDIFIRTLLFDALIGNHDRHGRNIGLVRRAGRLELAPIYDNVSYLALEKGSMLRADFNPTGKISTQATLEPSMSDYVIELKRLGYIEYVDHFHHLLYTGYIEQIEKLITNSFCSVMMQEALWRLIKKRYGEMNDALTH